MGGPRHTFIDIYKIGLSVENVITRNIYTNRQNQFFGNLNISFRYNKLYKYKSWACQPPLFDSTRNTVYIYIYMYHFTIYTKPIIAVTRCSQFSYVFPGILNNYSLQLNVH